MKHPVLGTWTILLVAAGSSPTPAELMERGLREVTRQTVANPYAGQRREEILFERPDPAGERWRCLVWSDGRSTCLRIDGGER